MILVCSSSSSYLISVTSTRTDKLQQLGGGLEPDRKKTTLIRFLAKNPGVVNTPQTPQESYREQWLKFPEQDQAAIITFLNENGKIKRSLKAILSSPCHIGITKFALGTCEALVRSRITDWDQLRKDGASVGMEVCTVQPLSLFGKKITNNLDLGKNPYVLPPASTFHLQSTASYKGQQHGADSSNSGLC